MTHMANHARVVNNLEVMASLVHKNNVSTNVTQSNDYRPCSPKIVHKLQVVARFVSKVSERSSWHNVIGLFSQFYFQTIFVVQFM